MKTYFLQTFWCAMNLADSEKIAMILAQSWFKKIDDYFQADLIILNTCSVRKKWEDRVFSFIRDIVKSRKVKNLKNWQIIWITWCMVRKTGINKKYFDENYKRNTAKKIEFLKNSKSIFNDDDKLFPRLKDLDFTFRIEEIKYLPHILSHIYKEKIWQDDKFDDYLKMKQLRENPSQASIVIQTWCDNFCTYCIVPYTRWREFSRSKKDIIKDCKEAVLAWAKEITLLWQNVNSYWKQFVDKSLWNQKENKWMKITEIKNKSPFRLLLEEISKIKWIDRIRFTSSNPHDMTKDILDSHFEIPKMCNYLHFALQSGSDEILKKMNRKHTYRDFKKMVKYLRENDPYFSISTDIIVGFPWETDKMFEKTLKAFEECVFDFAYIARYSERVWTISEKLYKDNISEKIKSERWHKLNDALMKSLTKRNKMMIWKEEEILICWIKNWQFFWRTRNFKEVFINKLEINNKPELKVWDLVKVKITKLNKWVLEWELI